MAGLVQDLKLAMRALVLRWRFSLVVIATMSIGIGTTVGVWAYLSYFVRPTLDAPDPSRLVWVRNPAPDDPWRQFNVADWRHLRGAGGEALVESAALRLYNASMQSSDTTLHVFGTAASGAYFDLLGARPALGRLFRADDDRPGAEPVLVLSHLTWRRHFGADPAIIGRTVGLDGRHAYTVIGVTEPDFQGTGVWTAVYTPLAHAGPLLSSVVPLDEQAVTVLARLRANISIDEARERVESVVAGLEASRPLNPPREAHLAPVREFDDSYAEEPIYQAARVLMVAVTLLLLLACANVASLMLALGVARRRETAIFAALGAGRWRVARRFLLESVMLSTAGGLAGLLFVRPILRLIEHYLRMEVPVSMGDWNAGTHLDVNHAELAWFVAGVSVLTGVLFGLAPVAQAMRADLVSALKSAGGGAAGRRFQGRDVLVVVQVALSVMLLSLALVLGRTLLSMENRPLGFDAENLFLATVYLPQERLDEPQDGLRLLQELRARIAELPGVESASLAHQVPLSNFPRQLDVAADGERLVVSSNSVGREYFDTLRIPLLSGRPMAEADGAEAPRVVVLNRTAAERLFDGRAAVGETITVYRGDEAGARARVIGVVEDSVGEQPSRAVPPQVFFAFPQEPSPRPTVVLRARGPVEQQLRDLLRAGYPDLAVLSLVPFDEQMRRALSHQQMNADLSGGLAALALLLADLGIFSIMSYTISARSREIGIRMALGAERHDVRRWVLAETMRHVSAGVVLGLVGAWWFRRVLESLLTDVSARDVSIIVVVPLVLTVSALLAAWLPARRATGVEPMSALRHS